MRSMIKTGLAVTAIVVLAGSLGGCVTARLHLADDYGQAVRQNVVSQVDDPDAKYLGIPEGGAHGARVGLAQDRYVSGQVIPPAATSTSSVSAGGGGSSPK
jgi:hypothetical protein